MTRKVNVAVIAALVAIGTSAQARAHGGPSVEARAKNTLMSIPNLSAEQKTRIDDLLKNAGTQSAPLRQQIMTDHKELANLWAADNVDKQAVAAKQGDIDGAAKKLKGIWTDFFMQLHDVLTSPQRAWLALHGPGLMHANDGEDVGHGCPCEQQQLAPPTHR